MFLDESVWFSLCERTCDEALDTSVRSGCLPHTPQNHDTPFLWDFVGMLAMIPHILAHSFVNIRSISLFFVRSNAQCPSVSWYLILSLLWTEAIP